MPKRRGKAEHRRGRPPFAIPTTGLVRGAAIKAKVAPWFLKRALSRPEHKRHRLATAA